MAQPVIGLTLDSEPPGGYSGEPWYAIRENYCTAVAAAAWIPIALPHEPELAERYLETVDGLVITGGAFDVDPPSSAPRQGTRPSPPRTAAPPSSLPSPAPRIGGRCPRSASAAANS